MVWYKYCLKLFSAVQYQSYCNMFALESMLYTAAEQVCQRIHTESSCSSSWFIIIVIVIVIVVVVIIITIIIIIIIITIIIISITNITIIIIIIIIIMKSSFIIMKSSSSSSPAGLPPSQLPFSNSPLPVPPLWRLRIRCKCARPVAWPWIKNIWICAWMRLHSPNYPLVI